MRVVTIIPTYNERQSLPITLERLRAAVPHSDVLIVDDNSPDGTGQIVTVGKDLRAGMQPQLFIPGENKPSHERRFFCLTLFTY